MNSARPAAPNPQAAADACGAAEPPAVRPQVSASVATRWPGPVRLWGGTVAVSFVVAFWVTAFLVKRAGHPVAHPLLDVIFLGYLFLSPALSFLTLILLKRAMNAGVQPKRPLPIQAWLSFAALAAWVIGLGFLDLN